MKYLAADEISWQEYNWAQLEHQLSEQRLVAVLEHLHLAQGLDVHVDGNVSLHLVW